MSAEQKRFTSFQAFVYGIALAIMVGWLFWIGKAIILPIMAAVIAVYVLTTASSSLRKLSLLKHSPEWLRRLLVLSIFILFAVFLVMVVANTVDRLIQSAPTYQNNLERIFAQTMAQFNIETPNLSAMIDEYFSGFSLQSMISYLISSLTNFGSQLFIVVIYTSFLLTERHNFSQKLAHAFTDHHQAERVESLIREINLRIGEYLTTKTLVNFILAMISYVILWFLGVDFALFWALMIGLFNYIPYVGSIIAVLLPILLTLAQFGSIQITLITAALLIGAQTYVGNILEPKMIGRSVNLSPFVVLVSLAFWASIWGLPGAILSTPLTSMVTIIFASFDVTRPLAILLASQVDEDQIAHQTPNKS